VHSAPLTEYVPVDNRGQRHPTAGSALNEGVRAASREYVAFVQQDIFLHSLVELEEAAGMMAADPSLGLLGTVGVTRSGRILGLMRDRVVLIGEALDAPAVVDSLDEVLFIGRRSRLLTEPLSEDPALAWHAYAVEYGLRMRDRDLKVAAVDIPITHNSRSTNLVGLEQAHAAVACLHPQLVPVRTTCGTVTSGTRKRVWPETSRHRWRLRWLTGSWAARRAKVASGTSRIVLVDVRPDIDKIMKLIGADSLHVHNVVEHGRIFPDSPTGTVLKRHSRTVRLTSGPLSGWSGSDIQHEPTLLTNLSAHHLSVLKPEIGRHPHVIGYSKDIGYWAVFGSGADEVVRAYGSGSSRPAPVLLRSTMLTR
jgi:hypothetical protein